MIAGPATASVRPVLSRIAVGKSFAPGKEHRRLPGAWGVPGVSSPVSNDDGLRDCTRNDSITTGSSVA